MRHFHDHGERFFGGHFGRGRHGGGRGIFGHFGSRGMGGGDMRGGRVLSADDLQLVILALVEEKARHGYEIMKALSEKSSGIYKPSPGMIYPALTYLEEVSYVVSETDGAKKLIRITDEGKKFLEENRAHTVSVLENLERYGQKMAHFQEQMNQEEEADEKWGGTPKEQQKKEWRETKAEFHEIRNELKAALFEKLLAPLEEKKRVLEVLRQAVKEIRKK